MNSEETKYEDKETMCEDNNVKKSSNTGKLVAGAVAGAVAAGGAVYASEAGFDDSEFEVADSNADNNAEIAEEEQALEEAIVDEEVLIDEEDIETGGFIEDEEVVEIEESFDANDDKMAKLEDYISDRNQESVEELEAEEDGLEILDDVSQTEDVAIEAVPAIEEATGVNDEMSFNEAFAAARAEVGSGGIFEWHGSKYNTFTAEEWNAMSNEEKIDFQNSVYESNPVASTEAGTPEIEVEIAQDTYEADEIAEINDEDIVLEPEDIEIEVLGYEYNADYDLGFNEITSDNQEIVLVDLDGDGSGYEVALIDSDGDGIITNDEVLVLDQDAFNADDLNIYASNDIDFDMDNDDINDFDMDIDA